MTVNRRDAQGGPRTQPKVKRGNVGGLEFVEVSDAAAPGFYSRAAAERNCRKDLFTCGLRSGRRAGQRHLDRVLRTLQTDAPASRNLQQLQVDRVLRARFGAEFHIHGTIAVSRGKVVDSLEANGIEGPEQRTIEERLFGPQSGAECTDLGVEVDLSLSLLRLEQESNDGQRKQKSTRRDPPLVPGPVARGEFFQPVERFEVFLRNAARGSRLANQPRTFPVDELAQVVHTASFTCRRNRSETLARTRRLCRPWRLPQPGTAPRAAAAGCRFRPSGS